ncbi:MAG TPA: glycogen phosphorylase [Lachnospiraceae bacterium]|nr:glycogen phosphorylase [Lachnospiraceae bacterium]
MNFDREQFKNQLITNVRTLSRKTIETATKEQLYEALVFTIRDYITDKWLKTHETYDKEGVKIVCYLSMEFLMGRFMGNAILNMTMLDEVKEVLKELDIDYNTLENVERDPGLGNGGLGRLAACFLDSLSTLGYPAYGCGIRYHYGIFEQKIENGYQVEVPDNWLENGDIWGVKRQEYAQEVRFGGTVKAVKQDNGEYKFVQENCESIMAIPYDYPVVGYDNNTVNTLRLWDAEAKEEFDLQSFNAGDYSKAVERQNVAKTLTEVLYPADEHYAGKELRLRQQYFFVSATLQRIVSKYKKKFGNDLTKFHEKYALQLNDTHPSVAVAELMRIFIDENNMDWDTAWEVTKKTCAYTNHTIMSEALEKWPIELFSRLLPRIYMIVEEINKRFCAFLIDKYGNDANKIRRMAIVADGQIRMAFLAIVGSHSVNGVAALHTEILKNQELKDFYDIFPERFNNKTNGITQRRWLGHANTALSSFITDTIGNGWYKNLDELKGLVKYADNEDFCKKFMEIKRENKVKLAEFFKATKGIDINPDSIYDIQVKRLHEYKRQLLNILHVMSLYNKLRVNPGLDMVPRTFIFGAKSAAAYKKAKLIIKLINSVADVVNNDETIEGKLKVIFAENYRVSLAEMLIPAADVSEQISTASKEASGTGNMKFMLNGAVTIGTLDGANVEMREEVGDDNIFIFGMHADEVIRLQQENNYNPWDIYNLNSDVRAVMNMLINGTLDENSELFRPLYDSLLNGTDGARADMYYVLKDFDAYAKAQEEIEKAYKDKRRWAKMAVMNTACSGKFSSDRTIKQYAEEIWKLDSIDIKL